MNAVAMIHDSAPSDADDVTLERRFARGDAEAFKQVVALYQSRVIRLAGRLLGWQGGAEDIVQDVFLAAWTKAHTYRGDAPLWNWLTIITVNRCRTLLRRKAMLSRLTAGLMGRSEEFSPASDANSLVEESNQRVRAAMASLPSRDREVVVLLYLEHRRPAEIATLLEISVNAVNVRLHRARQKLKVLLEDADGGMS